MAMINDLRIGRIREILRAHDRGDAAERLVLRVRAAVNAPIESFADRREPTLTVDELRARWGGG